MQNVLLPMIAKGHPLQCHRPSGPCERTRLRVFRDIGGFVQELQGALQARLRRLQGNDSVANGGQRSIQLDQIRHNDQQLPNREAFGQDTMHPQVEHDGRPRGRKDVTDDTIGALQHRQLHACRHTDVGLVRKAGLLMLFTTKSFDDPQRQRCAVSSGGIWSAIDSRS